MRISNRPIAGAASAFLLLFSLAATTANAFAASGGQHSLPTGGDDIPTGVLVPTDGGQNSGDPNCQDINVPSGNRFAFALFAKGALIYRWDGANWTVVSSKALLFSPEAAKADSTDGAAPLGTLVAGPTWQSFDGSRVVGNVIAECDPVNFDAQSSQLIEAVDNEGFGIFTDVTFIQRLDTSVEAGPATRGEFVGQKVKVPFTALFAFYRSTK